MIIEMHVHGRPHKFGISKADTFCKIAKSKGIDALVFTEHSHTESNGFWNDDNVRYLEDKHNIKIMVGQELTTNIGHVLAYNVPIIKKKYDIKDLQTNDNIALVAAHPCRKGGEKFL